MIPDTAEAPPPSRLGRYELLGRLATGGMAEIYLARLAGEAGFEKTVVVKRLHPALAAADDYVRMFLDEGKLVARLDHPNVCEVHELGREGSDYFLAMPFLDGVAATELIARARDPNRIAQLRVAAGVIVQACAGLHHAHELRGPDGALLGLVHRDASPSNLFVTTSGVIKVLDFGIAKVRGAQATEVGVIKGKWQYMAPEQVLGEDLDRRCDVFALGIVLFELATHQRLFKRDSEFLAARAVLEEPIPRADEVDPAVPRALADVIAKALARDKASRYPDARAFGDAIEEVMAEHNGVASAGEIAGALALEHADELTAQRTRRLRIVSHAREESTVATARRVVGVVASGEVDAHGPTDEVDAGGSSNTLDAHARTDEVDSNAPAHDASVEATAEHRRAVANDPNAAKSGSITDARASATHRAVSTPAPSSSPGRTAPATSPSSPGRTAPTDTSPTTERMRAPARGDASPQGRSRRATIVAVLATLTLAAGAIVAIVLAMVPGDDATSRTGAGANQNGSNAHPSPGNEGPTNDRPANDLPTNDRSAANDTSATNSASTSGGGANSGSSANGAGANPGSSTNGGAAKRGSSANGGAANPGSNGGAANPAGPGARVPTAPAGDIDMLGSDAPTRDIEMPPARVGTRPSPTPKPPGQLSIESTPYAKIFVDGRPLGVTPVIHQAVPAGRRRIRAVLADGRSKEWTVDIPPGRAAAPINLTW